MATTRATEETILMSNDAENNACETVYSPIGLMVLGGMAGGTLLGFLVGNGIALNGAIGASAAMGYGSLIGGSAGTFLGSCGALCKYGLFPQNQNNHAAIQPAQDNDNSVFNNVLAAFHRKL